jgi:hypothetical protein
MVKVNPVTIDVAKPVPLSSTVNVWPSESEMVSEPTKVPDAVGVKITLIPQAPPPITRMQSGGTTVKSEVLEIALSVSD